MEEMMDEQYFCQQEEDIEADGYDFDDRSFAENEDD